MGFFAQVKKWVTQVYLIEENDPVHGGEQGITNRPLRELADRTEYLKAHLTPKQLGANSTNTSSETGHSHAIDSASTTRKGIVQLNNTLTSTSQEQALTAAQGKVLNDKITQNEQKTLERTNQKVNKTDVSDAVNSTSQTTVGSSRAVKTAYDKGVEAKNAADNAQNSANNANNNANNRVSKLGDTMTGNLVVPYLKATGQYLSVTAKNNQFAGLDVIRQGNIGNWLSRIEALPDKRWKFWTEGGYDVFVPNRNGTLALDEDVRNKVAKTGDEINWLRVINDNSVLHLKSRNSAGAYIDFSVWNSSYAHSSIECIDVGNWATELRFHTTPQGDDYNSDRRHHVASINPNGAIWAKEYGWLHDYFLKRSDCIRSWYPNHYAGTEVYKIRHLGLMITLMNTTGGNQELLLPESYDGHAIVLANDRGDGGINVQRCKFLGGNRIFIGGRWDTHCSVLIIGSKNV